MTIETFNPELFKQVFKSNLDMLVNSMNARAFEKAAMTGQRQMTEDETREFARDYFNKLLAQKLAERL